MSKIYLGMYELGGAYNGYNHAILVSSDSVEKAMHFVGRHAVKEFEGEQKRKGISYDIEECPESVKDTLKFRTRLTDQGRKLAQLSEDIGEIHFA